MSRTIPAEAVHEAGHATACHVLGVPIVHVKLGRHRSGECQTAREPGSPQERAVISLAGPAATFLLCGPDRRRWRREDVDRTMARQSVGDSNYFKARRRARRLVADHLPELGAIARELARRKRLTAGDVAAIIEAARRTP